MIGRITNDLNKTMRTGRLAQARKQLVEGLADRADAEALADAVINLTHRLSGVSLEERLLVASKVDPLGYAKHVQALAAYAQQWEHISPHDLGAGEDLTIMKQL